MAGRKKRRRRAHREAQQKGALIAPAKPLVPAAKSGKATRPKPARSSQPKQRQVEPARTEPQEPARERTSAAAAAPASTPADLPRELPPVLRVWRNRNYVLFEAGWFPSSITYWMQRVGATWLAWELSHSNAWVGAIAAADLAPMIVLSPIAGALMDRSSNPVRVLLVMKVLLLLQAIALAGFAVAGTMTIELLFALSLMTGILNPFDGAARQVVLAASIPRTDFGPAIALDSALFQSTRFIGPAVAALIISSWSVTTTFLAHVAGSVVILIAIALMRVPTVERKTRRRRGLIYDVIDSVRYARAHGAIWPLFVLLSTISILLRPIQDLLPGFASKVFMAGPEGLAWLASGIGVGAMTSATVIALRGRVEGLSTFAIVGGFMMVASMLAFTATDRLWLGLVLIALIGFSVNTMSTSIQTITQLAVSDDMRGRVMSLYTLIFRGLPAIGAVVVGALADRIGLPRSFEIVALVALVVCILVALRWKAIAAAANGDA